MLCNAIYSFNTAFHLEGVAILANYTQDTQLSKLCVPSTYGLVLLAQCLTTLQG